jgi:glucose/arabinose dehydrogenase
MKNFLKHTIWFSLIIFWGIFSESAIAISSPCPDNGAPFSQVHLRLKPIIKGMVQPLGLNHAGDHSNRIFVVEQRGVIWIIENGKKRETPFLDIQNKITAGGEMGLLGLAFHPGYSENHRLFVNYTEKSFFKGIRSIIAEYKTGTDSNKVDPGTEQILLSVSQPFTNHKGGNLVFGPEGYLYIGFGDGGSGNDPLGNGQNLNTLLGKMLRIDIDHSSIGTFYGIPPDNPFVGRKNALPEIWAYGLRNPWRYSFDALTGKLYVGDVGQKAREEIDIIQKGKNYGWNIMEGNICTPGVNPNCQRNGLELPILDYGRTEGTAVIGGYVYRGDEIPSLCGVYVYGDFGNGRIWGLRYNGKSVTEQHLLLETHLQISSFGEDENHGLYVIDYNGEVLKLEPE